MLSHGFINTLYNSDVLLRSHISSQPVQWNSWIQVIHVVVLGDGSDWRACSWRHRRTRSCSEVDRWRILCVCVSHSHAHLKTFYSLKPCQIWCMHTVRRDRPYVVGAASILHSPIPGRPKHKTECARPYSTYDTGVNWKNKFAYRTSMTISPRSGEIFSGLLCVHSSETLMWAIFGRFLAAKRRFFFMNSRPKPYFTNLWSWS